MIVLEKLHAIKVELQSTGAIEPKKLFDGHKYVFRSDSM